MTRLCRTSSSLTRRADSSVETLSTGTPVHVETTDATSLSVTVGTMKFSTSSTSTGAGASPDDSASPEAASATTISWICWRSFNSSDFSSAAARKSCLFTASSFFAWTSRNSVRTSLAASGIAASCRNCTRAPASSSTSMALSGRKRSWMYCEASFTQATSASSEYLSLWCASYFRARPVRICTVSSTVGSGTWTGWKRRSSALSFSTYFRYSSTVVAPMTWRSPRDSAGFRMFAASMAPPPPSPPAPTSVWISSIMRMTFWSCCTSLMMFLRRSSNSPRYFVPERSMPRSSSMMRLPWSRSGTSPAAIRMASPSAMAVLPTPGSPMSTGLFFCLRARIWMVRSISSSLPTSGSISPAAAALVRSLPNSSSVPAFEEPPPLVVTPTRSFSSLSFASVALSSLVISLGISVWSTLIFSNTLARPPSLSLVMARRM
mmetsp:Transcript_82105/g.244913  ORF Transcript_82105/g.244913 Transcript_82105/m.244913 type:complete len:434 (-) Transcript_82105:122-1423(-)